MLKKGRPFQVVYCALTALVLTAAGCGSKNSSQKNAFSPEANVSYEEEAKPTVVVPPPQNDVEYQPAPDTVDNNGTQIHLNQTELSGARIHYSAPDRRLVVTGTVAILGENRLKLAEKNFSLSGIHNDEDATFRLNDEIAPTAGPQAVVVKGLANCLDLHSDERVSCEHVVVDVIVKYGNRYYSEQVEVNRNQPTRPAPPAAPRVQPQPRGSAPSPAPAPAEPRVDDGNDDGADAEQNGIENEGGDDSINGRYQGALETIDLTEFFTDPAPAAPAAPPSGDASRATPPASGDTSPAAPPSGDASRPAPAPEAPPAPARPAPEPETPRRPDPAPETPRRPEPSTPRSADTTPRDRELSPDLLQTRDGEVRPRNQAIGLPDHGRLRNATSMMTKAEALGRRAYFVVASPTLNKHFATFDMAELIVRAGNVMHQRYTKKLYLSRVSARNGGRLPPSVSHQIGNDVDLGYPNDGTTSFPIVVTRGGSYRPSTYSVQKTYELFKYLFAQDIKVERIFVDQKIKNALCTYAKSIHETTGRDRELVKRMFDNVQHSSGHGNHFHVRIKCSRFDPGCRGRVYRKIDECK